MMIRDSVRGFTKGESHMLSWLSANIGTVLVVAVLILIVALIVRSMLRDKKAGRSSCGNNCAHCQMAGQCHKARGS